MKKINLNILLIFVFIAVVMTLFVNKLTTPRILDKNELLINGLFLFDKPKEISEFEFFSGDDNSFTKDDLKDKWTLMYFGFTNCPDECPTTMYEMSKLLKVLKEKNYPLEDKQWVLASIDPERDTAESIDKYAKGFSEDFVGIRGSRPMLLNLATQLSVNNVMPSSNHMDHSHLDQHVNNIILINPDADFAGFFRPPFTTSRLSLTYQSVTTE
jgi:protein SCO1/2